MPKNADQADAATREILGPQFTAMRTLVDAVENNRQKADALAKAQDDHTESTVQVVEAFDAAKAAGFTAGQLKKGGYVRPSVKATSKSTTKKADEAATESATPAVIGSSEDRDSERSADDQHTPEHHHHADRPDERSEHDALAS